jgi:DNA-binding MarR family transcriptional regulator
MRTISQPGRAAVADARRLRRLLAATMRRRSLRDPIAAACAAHHLSAPQVHTVLALGAEGALTMGDLARRVAVTEKTVTGLVDRLERDGLVARRRDEADRRIIHVALTAAGKALHRRLDAGLLRALALLLGRLDGADRRDLFRIAGKLSSPASEDA